MMDLGFGKGDMRSNETKDVRNINNNSDSTAEFHKNVLFVSF